MPTYATTARFDRDNANLGPDDKVRFRRKVEEFRDDLVAGGGFRSGLRVKRVQGTANVWEMTWAPDGRSTLQYGEEQIPGQPHVIWRRVETHGIVSRP